MNNKLKILLSTSLLFTTLSVNAQNNIQSKELKSVQGKIEKTTKINLNNKKQKMMNEAIKTIQQTAMVLKALDNNKTSQALDTLAKISGNIDLIIARDPSLELLPISISHKQQDILVTKDMIKSLLYDANQALKNGRIQEARNMLKDLASEIVITTTSIPLATYPDDIKTIAPLIDKGKIQEAKIALKSVLNSLVVTQQIIPLPIIRTTYLLEQAETLAIKEKRTSKDNEKLSKLIKEATSQLEMAELLGYGTRSQFKDIYEQIDIIKDKTSNNKNGNGWFDTIKNKLSKLVK